MSEHGLILVSWLTKLKKDNFWCFDSYSLVRVITISGLKMIKCCWFGTVAVLFTFVGFWRCFGAVAVDKQTVKRRAILKFFVGFNRKGNVFKQQCLSWIITRHVSIMWTQLWDIFLLQILDLAVFYSGESLLYSSEIWLFDSWTQYFRGKWTISTTMDAVLQAARDADSGSCMLLINGIHKHHRVSTSFFSSRECGQSSLNIKYLSRNTTVERQLTAACARMDNLR